ncbi:MAG: biopolymer transporter ExbD [Rikenellaceae bacterium]
MAIKRGSKVDKSFSSASMTDLMFLLLLFLLIATTLINPNAVKLTLPKSSNKIQEKSHTTVSIEQTPDGYRYYVELKQVDDLESVEEALIQAVESSDQPVDDVTVALHCDKGVAIDEVVQVMNIASKNKYKLILATTPN